MPSIVSNEFADIDSNKKLRGVKALVDGGIATIPDVYIKPVEKRPKPDEVLEGDALPVIDLTSSTLVDDISKACEGWGMFQVVNHGVSPSIIDGMLQSVLEFFDLPIGEKMQYYSEELFTPMRYCTSMTPSKETHMEWHDHLQHWFTRRTDSSSHPWPKHPESYREAASKYVESISLLGKRLRFAMSQGLGLDAEYFERAFGEHEMFMRSNYYPPCPNPELALGMNGHSDSGGLTILLQDEVGGLQAKKGDYWYQVKPRPNAFVVNVGDQIEVLSNGKYKSIVHRVTVNPKRHRLSIATFCNPSSDAVIGPIPELLSEENRPKYKNTMYGKYVSNVYTKYLEGKNVNRET